MDVRGVVDCFGYSGRMFKGKKRSPISVVPLRTVFHDGVEHRVDVLFDIVGF